MIFENEKADAEFKQFMQKRMEQLYAEYCWDLEFKSHLQSVGSEGHEVFTTHQLLKIQKSWAKQGIIR